MAGLTAQIAEFVAGPAPALSPEVLRTVRTGFVDTVGVMLAGAGEPVTGVVRGFVQAARSPLHDASVLLGAERASARDAALVNATAAHALDYDDVGLMGHPSVVLVPALLAEGERLHAGGLALMQAYVKGYEVWGELIARDQDRHHGKGWHPTAVFGVVAVAAAVAALRGLPAAQAQHAIGIAGSLASGLIANFGTMTKPFHAGQAAAHGIDAVNLAQAGMTAAPDAIEHHAGFLAALSPAGRVDRSPCERPLRELSRVATLGLTVKKYPMCFATHRVIDGVLDLAREHALDPQRVREVRAAIGVTQDSMLRNHDPRTGLEAKFSLEFAVAAGLAVRKVGLAELQDAFVRRADVQALMRKVRITTVDTVCPHEPTLSLSDRVVVEMDDGRVFDSGDIEETRGGLARPLLPGELESKFMDCTAASGVDGATLYGRLQRLETLDDVARLAAASAH
ncbi:MmgE/PrpD family protein [Ramlibacter sp. USB13]|uniref:MmgE/PrpD family protein n=1 Tax=Ramlibacter cellulosilyticus TaxID=2764187 RepID=A0A923S9B2_9BURK|nr:MmgE/PrpD family protein [Ramlibacter cellulosilyticus]MBC5781480.1 MmgE/PrpD family protein [Ramlibacter cellulosilyticus]